MLTMKETRGCPMRCWPAIIQVTQQKQPNCLTQAIWHNKHSVLSCCSTVCLPSVRQYTLPSAGYVMQYTLSVCLLQALRSPPHSYSQCMVDQEKVFHHKCRSVGRCHLRGWTMSASVSERITATKGHSVVKKVGKQVSHCDTREHRATSWVGHCSYKVGQ